MKVYPVNIINKFFNPSSWGFVFRSREDLIWHRSCHPERCFPARGSHLLYFFVF